VELSHPKESFKRRAEEALQGFPDCKQYVRLLNKLRSIRGEFVHTVSIGIFPETLYPDADQNTHIRRRAVTLEQSLESFESEGLALRHILVSVHKIAYWLVFNRIFKSLNVWPKIGDLNMVSTG
jgi:hypothetical protein